ncbi:unnamed protein product [Amoebophrya sp. A25]|nr:unnamed protein product [Amoebophrya sp. A25]|eukprot:GSA25T00021118001.1
MDLELVPNDAPDADAQVQINNEKHDHGEEKISFRLVSSKRSATAVAGHARSGGGDEGSQTDVSTEECQDPVGATTALLDDEEWSFHQKMWGPFFLARILKRPSALYESRYEYPFDAAGKKGRIPASKNYGGRSTICTTTSSSTKPKMEQDEGGVRYYLRDCSNGYIRYKWQYYHHFDLHLRCLEHRSFQMKIVDRLFPQQGQGAETHADEESRHIPFGVRCAIRDFLLEYPVIRTSPLLGDRNDRTKITSSRRSSVFVPFLGDVEDTSHDDLIRDPILPEPEASRNYAPFRRWLWREAWRRPTLMEAMTAVHSFRSSNGQQYWYNLEGERLGPVVMLNQQGGAFLSGTVGQRQPPPHSPPPTVQELGQIRWA